MKVIVFVLAPLWSPHFETDLELLARHRADGDEVLVVKCQRSLSSCVANPYNRLIDCIACQSKCGRGLAAIEIGAESQISMTSLLPHDGVVVPRLPKGADIDDLREIQFDGYNVGRGVASSLVSIVRDSSPDLAAHRSLVTRLLVSAVEMVIVTKAAITENKPDLVYVFNGRFATAAPIIEVCRRNEVRFRTHDALYQTGQYSVVEGGTVHSLEMLKRRIEDHWESGEEPGRSELAREFFEHRRFGGEGAGPKHLQFNRGQVRGTVPEAAGDGYVLILNSSEDEFTSIDGYENPVYEDQIAALDALLEDPQLQQINYVLRAHPNLANLNNRQTRHLDSLSGRPNLVVVRATDTTDTYALIESSRLVVTFGSTTGIEAVYWRRPSVLVGRAPYEDLGPLRIGSHQELVAAILDLPPAAGIEGSLKYGYFMRHGGEFFEYFDQLDYHNGRVNGVRVRPSPIPALLRRARNAVRLGVDTISPGIDQRQVSQR